MSSKFPQLMLFAIGLLGLLFAVFLGVQIGSDKLWFLAVLFMGALLLTWVVLGREYWWVPMMFGVGIGGFFTIPWKLFPHEIALAACGLALLPQVVFRRSAAGKERPPLPKVFYILAVYLICHYLGAVLIYRQSDALGNVSRAYMSAVWPFLFGFVFYRYGSTHVLRTGLVVIYLALVLRMIFGLTNYYTQHVYVIPGLNYTIDPQDLRASGLMLVTLALLFVFISRGVPAKVANFAMMGLAMWAVMLGGSRRGIATLLFIPCFVFFTLKRWTLLTSFALTALGGILLVNSHPHLLDAVPYRVARAFSIVPVNENKVDVQTDLQDSNLWHKVILPAEAYNRWSESPRSMVLGTGIKKYNPLVKDWAGGLDALYFNGKVSADMGAYESGFWTVLAVTGATGFTLYLVLVLQLFLRLYPRVWRSGIRDLPTAVGFWACLSIASWVAFCVPQGSYPSVEIFLSLLALAAFADAPERMHQRRSSPISNLSIEPTLRPSARALS